MNLIYKYILSSLSLLIFFFTIFLGLSFKGSEINNTVYEGSDGLYFTDKSFALSELYAPEKFISSLEDSGLFISFTIKPEAFFSSETKYLFRMFLDEKGSGLNVFFWGDKLIAVLGDDIDYSKKYPRVSVLLDKKEYKVSIFLNESFMGVFLDGVFIEKVITSNHSLSLRVGLNKIIFGGHLIGEKSWVGKLMFFSVGLAKAKTLRLDKIDIKSDIVVEEKVYDYKGVRNKVFIPDFPVLFDRNLFAETLTFDSTNMVAVMDVFLNFIWFFVLSCITFLFLISLNVSLVYSFLGIISYCILLSLSIEYAQSWLPMRDSSIRDLFFNSLGGFFGAILISIVDYLVNKKKYMYL